MGSTRVRCSGPTRPACRTGRDLLFSRLAGLTTGRAHAKKKSQWGHWRSQVNRRVRLSYLERYTVQILEVTSTGGELRSFSCMPGLIVEPEIPT